MATQTISAVGKPDRVEESARWTERRALALWIVGSAAGWAAVIGLIYLGAAVL